MARFEITPEMMARIRRPRPPGKLKNVVCPHCDGILTRVDSSVKIDLYRHPTRKKISCQQYMKCHTCGEEIGIILTSPNFITE